MTVEQIEIRKILTQMLADAGINRETLKDLVREVLEEKVEKAANDAMHQINIDARVDRIWDRYIENEIARAARAAIADKINCYFSKINVTLDFGGRKKITSE